MVNMYIGQPTGSFDRANIAACSYSEHKEVYKRKLLSYSFQQLSSLDDDKEKQLVMSIYLLIRL